MRTLPGPMPPQWSARPHVKQKAGSTIQKDEYQLTCCGPNDSYCGQTALKPPRI